MTKTETQYLTVKLTTPTDFVHDQRKHGWELIEDVELVGEPTLGLAEFLREGEKSVKGDVMRERAKEAGNMAGQRHAERLLSQSQTIPVEWRGFYLVFPGTLWRDPHGYLRVPYLRWDGGEWRLRWHWLDYDWYSRVRLVRVCE